MGAFRQAQEAQKLHAGPDADHNRHRPPKPRQAESIESARSIASPTVYLAEVTDDLDSIRTKVTRALQQRNIRVIPDTWYPRDPEGFQKAVEDGLKEADLFVQLFLALASWCATRGRMHKIGG